MASIAHPSYGLSDREYSPSRRTATSPGRAMLVGRYQAPGLVVVECDPSPELPGWFNKALAELERIINLPTDWDGYGSEPVAAETAVKALLLLTDLLGLTDAATPWVVPLSDGGIQLEWKRNGFVLEVQVPASDTEDPTAFAADENCGESWEGSVAEIPGHLLASAIDR